MEEIGRVIDVQNNNIIIELGDSSQCGSCNSCGSGDRGQKILSVENTLDAKVNDRVILDISPVKSILASLTLFVFPLLMMIAGYFIGENIGQLDASARGENPVAIISSIVFLFLSLGMIYYFDRYLGKRNKLKPRLVGLYGASPERVPQVFPLNQ